MAKKLGIFALILILAGAFFVYRYYNFIFSDNIMAPDETVILVPSNADYEQLVDSLNAHNILNDPESFRWVSGKMDFTRVKPGRYVVQPDWNNKDLISMFRAGKQTPIDVTFNNVRTIEELAGVFGAHLEPDSTEFLQSFTDSITLDSLGYTRENILSLFIPNTYEFFWDSSTKDVLDRMVKENKKFWNERRTALLNKLVFSKKEIYTLASIVQKETNLNREKPLIAGVYINRMRKRIPLQADPTVVFASGDFSIRRVLLRHLSIDSPYNTYLYPGLPPGPICMPDIATIDAVLNHENHNYLYFCASPDNSGAHVFAATLRDHNRNANAYRTWLNQQRIFE